MLAYALFRMDKLITHFGSLVSYLQFFYTQHYFYEQAWLLPFQHLCFMLFFLHLCPFTRCHFSCVDFFDIRIGFLSLSRGSVLAHWQAICIGTYRSAFLTWARTKGIFLWLILKLAACSRFLPHQNECFYRC